MISIILFQASGIQVQQSADRFNAEISTRSSQNGTSTDYECSIVGTNRAYDNDGEDRARDGADQRALSVLRWNEIPPPLAPPHKGEGDSTTAPDRPR